MHILIWNTRSSADLCYRPLFIAAQETTKIVIALFPRVARLGLRMKPIFIPKTA